jgi:hypothetical protein
MEEWIEVNSENAMLLDKRRCGNRESFPGWFTVSVEIRTVGLK